VIGRRLALSLGAASIAMPLRAQPRGRIHALLVGINSYRIRPLQGCVNDVRLIERNLQPLGAQTTTLLEAEATRAGFDARWREATARVAPGDRFIFHFAGHGMRRPGPPPGPGLEDRGDFFVFRDYHPAQAPGEILLDTDLHTRLIEVNRRGAEVLVLLDCCHAGALTRSMDPRAAEGAGVRTMAGGVDMADVAASLARLPPPPPPPAPGALEPILFIAAGQAIEVVPEVTWENRRHGALSVGFATAIAGAADRNRDGVLTRGELFDHILISSRTLAESRQHPVMQPAGRLAEPVLALPRSAAAIAATPAAPAPATELPVRVSVLNLPPAEAAALLRRIPNAVPADSGAWDLRWDARTSEAWGSARDRLSDQIGEAALPAVVQRVRAQRRLVARSLASGLDFRLVWADAQGAMEHDAAHPRGRVLELRLAGLRHPFLLMFNLAGDGKVQQLMPHPNDATGAQPRFEPSIGLPPTRFRVTAPFGSDLAVAVCTDRPLPALVAAMRRFNDRPVPWEMVAALEEGLAGISWQIGVQTVVTRER